MHIEPSIEGCSIVLIGHFNPAIFVPHWFGKQKIVAESEANSAEIGVIHPELASFRLGEITVNAERERFAAELTEAPWVRVRDFVIKTFREFLVHTPITAVGINRLVHFGVGSEETRNRIGNALAPLAPWGDWGNDISKAPAHLRGGVKHLTIQETWRDENFSGHVQALVQPSNRISGSSGIFMNVNYHAQLINSETDNRAESAMDFLDANFDPALKKAEHIFDQIMLLKDKV